MDIDLEPGASKPASSWAKIFCPGSMSAGRGCGWQNVLLSTVSETSDTEAQRFATYFGTDINPRTIDAVDITERLLKSSFVNNSNLANFNPLQSEMNLETCFIEQPHSCMLRKYLAAPRFIKIKSNATKKSYLIGRRLFLSSRTNPRLVQDQKPESRSERKHWRAPATPDIQSVVHQIEWSSIPGIEAYIEILSALRITAAMSFDNDSWANYSKSQNRNINSFLVEHCYAYVIAYQAHSSQKLLELLIQRVNARLLTDPGIEYISHQSSVQPEPVDEEDSDSDSGFESGSETDADSDTPFDDDDTTEEDSETETDNDNCYSDSPSESGPEVIDLNTLLEDCISWLYQEVVIPKEEFDFSPGTDDDLRTALIGYLVKEMRNHLDDRDWLHAVGVFAESNSLYAKHFLNLLTLLAED